MFTDREIANIIESNCGTAENPKPKNVIEACVANWEKQLKARRSYGGQLKAETKEEYENFVESLEKLISGGKKLLAN